MTKKRAKARRQEPEQAELAAEPASAPKSKVARSGGPRPDVEPAKDPPEVEDHTDEVFGLDAAIEEPEPEPEGEEPQKPEKPAGEPEGGELEPEPAKELESAPDGDGEPETASPEAKKSEKTPEEEAKRREEGLRREIVDLRSKLRNLEAEKQRISAPMPLPQQQVADQGAEIQLKPEDIIQTQFVGDTIGPRRSDIETIAREEIRKAMTPDPQAAAAHALENVRNRWVSADPGVRGPAADRIRQAAELIDLSVAEYARRTNHEPSGFSELIQTIEQSGIADNFRSYFPEITSIPEFVDVVAFRPGSDISQYLWRLENYMDRYVSSSGKAASPIAAAVSGQQPAGNEEQGGQVLELSQQRPRSMAQKGHGTEMATTDRQRFDKLVEQLSMDQFSPEARELEKEATALARKLGIKEWSAA